MVSELNPVALGIGGGVAWGLCIFGVGLMATYANMAVPFVNTLGSAYLGYAPTLVGSIIGLIWAFVDAFVLLFITAWIYNIVIKKLSPEQKLQ
jgi:hypothetical protein